MKKTTCGFYLASLFLLVMACNTKETKTAETQAAELVFKADSVLFNKIEEDSLLTAISAAEVRAWSGDFFAADTLGDVKWILSEFFRIDSLKASGKYRQYTDHLDLGMTRDVTAGKIDEIRLDDKSSVRLWLLRHGTYEACPFTSGIEVLGTLVYEGKVSACFLLGQELHSSDPPVWLRKETYGDLYSNGLVRIQSKESDCEGETDKDNKEIVKSKSEELSFIMRGGKVADKVNKTFEN